MALPTYPIMDIFRENANPQKANQMAKYMKDRYVYLGLMKPQRTELSKSFLKEKCGEKKIDWDFIMIMYLQKEREFQYLAITYLEKMKSYMEKGDIRYLYELIVTKSWWDTVDSLSSLVGDLCVRFPELKEEYINSWVTDPFLWLRRVAIIFQLKYKTETDRAFLASVIEKNLNSKEFFINKAIGWALREYSKTNADWVKSFIFTHELSGLSQREASKYL